MCRSESDFLDAFKAIRRGISVLSNASSGISTPPSKFFGSAPPLKRFCLWSSRICCATLPLELIRGVESVEIRKTTRLPDAGLDQKSLS